MDVWIQVFFHPQANDLQITSCSQATATLSKSISFTSLSVQERGKKAQGTVVTPIQNQSFFSCLLCCPGQLCGLMSLQENVMLQLNCYSPTGVLANLSTERLCRLCLLTVVRWVSSRGFCTQKDESTVNALHPDTLLFYKYKNFFCYYSIALQD